MFQPYVIKLDLNASNRLHSAVKVRDYSLLEKGRPKELERWWRRGQAAGCIVLRYPKLLQLKMYYIHDVHYYI